MYLVRLWRVGDRWVVCLLKGVSVEEVWTYRDPARALLRYFYLKARVAIGML